jgi:hypothetical protein
MTAGLKESSTVSHRTSSSKATARSHRTESATTTWSSDEVRLEHAVEMYRSLPDAELAVVPGTSLGLLVEKPDLCNLLIADFLTKDPVQTFAPIRRAAPQSRRPDAGQ